MSEYAFNFDNFNVKQDYDFIEIGTCFFDTLIEKSHYERGISIEPIKQYLDYLPNKPNVIKLNAAIVCEEDVDKELLFYYITPEDAHRNNLGNWLLGCNRIGKPHDFHTGYYPDPGEWHRDETIRNSKENKRNLLEEGLVKSEKVQTFTFAQLVEKYKINSVNVLKIDTEGYDCKILNDVFEYCNKNESFKLPSTITFECNKHNDQLEVKAILQKIKDLNYKIEFIEDGNAVIAKSK